MRTANFGFEDPILSMQRSSEIVDIQCFPAMLRLKKPLIMSTYRLDTGPVLYVRIRSDDGHEGWGEAAANIVMSGETLTGMAAALHEFATPFLLGKSAFDRARLSQDLRASMFGNGAMLAAVDMALLDLAARLRGVPAVDLLGGAIRRSVPVLRLIGGSGNLDSDVADAKALFQEGFRAFKLKVGVSAVENEIDIVRALRHELGTEVLIGVDANMGWDRSAAVRFLSGASSSNLAFLEQPIVCGDVARLAAIRASSHVPVSIDESMHGVQDLHAHFFGKAIDGVSLKSIKLAGITPLVSIATIADNLGLSVNLAMMMESGLATSAMVHAACAIPQVDWGLSLGSLWISDNPVTAPECIDGRVTCFTRPGFGVDVDIARIRALAP